MKYEGLFQNHFKFYSFLYTQSTLPFFLLFSKQLAGTIKMLKKSDLARKAAMPRAISHLIRPTVTSASLSAYIYTHKHTHVCIRNAENRGAQRFMSQISGENGDFSSEIAAARYPPFPPYPPVQPTPRPIRIQPSLPLPTTRYATISNDSGVYHTSEKAENEKQ